MKAPRISLCMIVRDEEERLPRCLEAARPYVDEIIVVDTGSTDATMTIARNAGAVVAEMTWQDDFAAARNRTLELATGDWCLFLDADEVLSARAGKELRRVARIKEAVGIYFPLRDQMDGGKELVTMMFRAVRRRPAFRWRYRIHEQILPDVLVATRRENLRLVNATGEIVHDGYKTEVMASRRKDERNRRIYEAQILDTPDDVYMLYKFGDFLRRFPGEEVASEALLERGFRALQALCAQERKDLTFGGELTALLGLAKLGKRAFAECKEVLEWGKAEARCSGNLDYVLGQCQLAHGDGAAAERSFRDCAATHGKAALIPAQPQVTGTGARLGIARALWLQKRVKEAADTASDALDADPGNSDCVALWVDLATAAGDYSGLTARLIERVQSHPRCGMTWLKGGELFYRLKLLDQAAPWVLRATDLLPDKGPAYGLLGEILLALGHHEPASDAFCRGLPHPVCRAGVLVLALAYDITEEPSGDPTDAAVQFEFRRLVGNLKDLGESSLRTRLLAATRTEAPKDPAARQLLESALA